MLSYADLIINESTGIIVYPMTVLSNDHGVHILSTRAAALSLQFERLWILLYAESETRSSHLCIRTFSFYFLQKVLLVYGFVCLRDTAYL